MKINYVLIDYENVQPSIAQALASEVFKIIVFVGASQTRVNYDLIEVLQAKGDAARCIKISGNGRNALDFHISYYIGKLAAAEPDAYFHVIALDKGMDPLMHHLQELGVRAARWETVHDIPMLKTPQQTSDDQKLSVVIEYLLRRGAQRPAKLPALINSIATLFSPRLAEAETQALVSALEQQGVFERDGAKLKYGLPD